jgi:hypothetical protein
MAIWKIINEAERAGVNLFVHRGVVYFELAENPEADSALDQLAEVGEEASRELLRERGADAWALIQVWRSDPALRCRFSNIADFDDYAHRVGKRLLRSTLENSNHGGTECTLSMTKPGADIVGGP